MSNIVKSKDIENMIYEIRGVQVMLDSDLAKLYECTNGTKDINKAVKRNIERFPEDFMFQLNDEEFNYLRFQIGTSNIRGGRRYNPYVFTELGVAMLASVLHSEIAIKTSVKIIKSFVYLRNYMSSSVIEQKYINSLVLEDHSKIKLLEESFQKFEEKKALEHIYFHGQIYDAYSKILEIFEKAKKELIIIDSYADYNLLNIIKRLKVNVVLITKKYNLLNKEDISRYNKQYSNLKVLFDNTFHDRYFILDKSIVYHCGTSINRIGKSTFSITLMNDKDVCNSLIDKVKKSF